MGWLGVGLQIQKDDTHVQAAGRGQRGRARVLINDRMDEGDYLISSLHTKPFIHSFIHSVSQPVIYSFVAVIHSFYSLLII